MIGRGSTTLRSALSTLWTCWTTAWLQSEKVWKRASPTQNICGHDEAQNILLVLALLQSIQSTINLLLLSRLSHEFQTFLSVATFSSSSSGCRVFPNGYTRKASKRMHSGGILIRYPDHLLTPLTTLCLRQEITQEEAIQCFLAEDYGLRLRRYWLIPAALRLAATPPPPSACWWSQSDEANRTMLCEKIQFSQSQPTHFL